MTLSFAEVRHRKPYLDGPYFHDLRTRWADPPTLATPVSQLCTARQMEEPDHLRICDALHDAPRYHRKQWENAYIVRCLEVAGLLRPGSRGLGFGVGLEFLPAYFVAQGCDVLATDMPAAAAGAAEWAATNQHAASLDGLFHRHLVTREAFDARARFAPVDMKAVPPALTGYDFCWSSCCFEHLGSLQEGFDFVLASLRTLRPGGVAVHTTEFNLSDPERTLTSGPTVAYRESDITNFAETLRRQGHAIALNLHPGDHPLDQFVDRYLFGDPTLRFYVADDVVFTSIGLVIRKGT